MLNVPSIQETLSALQQTNQNDALGTQRLNRNEQDGTDDDAFDVLGSSVTGGSGLKGLGKPVGRKSAKLDAAQQRELRSAFKIFDKDGDGTIDMDELKTVLRSIGRNPTQKELEDMINSVDADGNGIIEYDEFMELMADKLPKADPDREINEAWDILSKGGQYADTEMLVIVFGNLGENIKDDAALKKVIEEADHDGDGKINYNDFYRTMKLVDDDLE